MDEHRGPPEGGGAQTPPSADHTITNTSRHHSNPRSINSNGARPVGRYSTAWRHGFGCGFRNALQVAARRLPPETWHTLDRLADEYDLAADSDG